MTLSVAMQIYITDDLPTYLLKNNSLIPPPALDNQ